jgi:ubiquinone/menaquinone biosynthesis C-methylase UbiE
MSSPVKRLLAPVKPLLEWLVQREAACAARWASAAHRRLRSVQWGLPPVPEHFDHHIDLHHQWLQERNSLWVERGVFGGLALKPGGALLELACGDGFNARNFYSLRCREVVACDFDPAAIAAARRKNAAPNVRFELADIRTAMPAGQFDNIVWDAAIEHFTPVEIEGVLRDIKARLRLGGVVSGYTITSPADGQKHLVHHEYEFVDKADLQRFLAPHFRRVTVFETVYPTRHNLYFWASDGTLPFDEDWAHVVRHRVAGAP